MNKNPIDVHFNTRYTGERVCLPVQFPSLSLDFKVDDKPTGLGIGEVHEVSVSLKRRFVVDELEKRFAKGDLRSDAYERLRRSLKQEFYQDIYLWLVQFERELIQTYPIMDRNIEERIRQLKEYIS